ncbi:MAG: hypothetical protein V1792_10495 [Pseudomonadota bacterium]
MNLEQHLTNLIRAGRHVIDSDFDLMAYHEWRREAYKCMDVLLDPEKGAAPPSERSSDRNKWGKPQA